ncbi:hypothetical protein GF318_00065 [Candidatus Micrarchaeota archaeon]|nr:hypothetical protein [Candidatus Micrarchaeota archaeon]
MRSFGLVLSEEIGEPTKFYYGMSTSRYSEPLDQLDVMLLMSKLRKQGLGNSLTIFVAGRFAQLNGRDRDELVDSEKKKVSVLSAVATVLDSVPVVLTTTTGLWSDPAYWKEVDRFREWDGILDKKRNGLPFSRVYESFEPELKQAMPPGLVSAISEVDAPSLYRLFEVAEASYMRKKMGIQAKAGPAFEEEYDRYIRNFMQIVQLSQPLDFRSTAKKIKPVVPYIGKQGEDRVFFSDGKMELCMKMKKLANRASGQPIYLDGNPKFMNPFVRMSVLAVEAAAQQDSAPVMLGSAPMSNGAAVARLFRKAGTGKLMKYASAVSECIWAYAVKPVQDELKRRGVEL